MRILAPFFLLLAAGAAHAGTPIQSPGNLGLGLGAGTHASGLSGKYFMAQDFSGQLVVGWWGAGRDSGGIGLSGDLLWEQRPLVTTEPFDLAWNVGPGVNLATANGALSLGVNGVLGLEFNFNPVPIDLVIEYRPGIRVIPEVDPDLIGFGAHVRVYPF